MLKTLKKGTSIQISEHLNSNEFDCKCAYPDCIVTLIDDALLQPFETIRSKFGPVIIDSGYRCKRHNEDIGGASGSKHVLGQAYDLSSLFASPSEIYMEALQIPVFQNGGLGGYDKWVHCDCRTGAARWGIDFSKQTNK